MGVVGSQWDTNDIAAEWFVVVQSPINYTTNRFFLATSPTPRAPQYHFFGSVFVNLFEWSLPFLCFCGYTLFSFFFRTSRFPHSTSLVEDPASDWFIYWLTAQPTCLFACWFTCLLACLLANIHSFFLYTSLFHLLITTLFTFQCT